MIDGPAGKLEALLDSPEIRPRAVVVFAHPRPQFEGSMHTKVICRAAKALRRIGFATLLFNFRGGGKSEGNFDQGRGELDDFRAGLDWAAAQYPGIALWAAGFSFGAWVALTVGAEDPRVSLLLGIVPLRRTMTFRRCGRARSPSSSSTVKPTNCFQSRMRDNSTSISRNQRGRRDRRGRSSFRRKSIGRR